MGWQNVALAAAGVIGVLVAVMHGILVQRHTAAPVEALAAAGVAEPIRRLVTALLQFSTFNWIVGGLALVAAALWLGREARLVIAILVGSSYLFGAVGNFWIVRDWHPGWMLYTAALVLIVYGVS